MKKSIALFLVFSILALSGNLYAEKKGTDLIVEKTDGTQVRGELIAVKQTSLLLLDRDSGADVTVDIGNIREITIVKKSKLLLGALIGLGLGALTGAYVESTSNGWGFTFILSIPLGALFGGSIGATFGTDETIQIVGKSDSEIQEILEKLRQKARIRDIQ